MLYVIPDILLKVALNTNNTGYQVVRYTWSIFLLLNIRIALKYQKGVNGIRVKSRSRLKTHPHTHTHTPTPSPHTHVTALRHAHTNVTGVRHTHTHTHQCDWLKTHTHKCDWLIQFVSENGFLHQLSVTIHLHLLFTLDHVSEIFLVTW